MFDYCLLRRDQYLADCLDLAQAWRVAVVGVECRSGRTDGDGDCWRLRRTRDAVLVTAPDGSSALHYQFDRARRDLLPRPSFPDDVYNF